MWTISQAEKRQSSLFLNREAAERIGKDIRKRTRMAEGNPLPEVSSCITKGEIKNGRNKGSKEIEVQVSCTGC